MQVGPSDERGGASPFLAEEAFEEALRRRAGTTLVARHSGERLFDMPAASGPTRFTAFLTTDLMTHSDMIKQG